MRKDEVKSVRQLSFVGGTSHRRHDGSTTLQASQVVFDYAPQEQPKESVDIHMSQVVFSHAPDNVAGQAVPVGCPCGTF